MPRQRRRSAPFAIGTPALDGPLDRLDLHRRAEAGQPVPALHDRSTASAINAKLVGSFRPDPGTGQLTVYVRRPAAGAVRRLRPPPLRLRPRPDGDADALHDLRRSRRTSSPGTTMLRRPDTRARSSASTPGPDGAPCPGQVRPFHPRLVAGTSNPVAGAFSRLPPEARPRRRRPVPRRPQLQDAARLHRRPARASPTARRPRSPPPRTSSGRAEQAAPSCPASSSDRHDQRRRRARVPPLPRGRQDVPGRARSKARRSQPGRDHPGAGRALRLRRRRRPGRPPRRSADGPGLARSPTRSRRSSAASRSGCARSRSTSTGRTSRSTRPTARRSRSTRQGIGDQGTVTDFSLLLPRRQLRDAAVQAEDDGPAARRPQGHAAEPGTRSCSSTCSTRPGDANIKSLSVTLPNAFEIDQRHLGNICSEKELGRRTVRRPHSRSARRRPRRRCSTSRSAAPPTRSPAPAACRDWPSSSTARSTSCPGPKPRRRSRAAS